MKMPTVVITGVLIVVVIGWVALPLWLEVRNAQQTVEWFVEQTEAQGAETKVVVSVRYPENPFTWVNAKPKHAVARHPFNSGYVVFSARYQESGEFDLAEFFVSADCQSNRFRLVDQSVYEDFLEEDGYDILGRRLPSWPQADPHDLAAVSLSQEWVRGRDDHLAFAVACRWEHLGVD